MGAGSRNRSGQTSEPQIRKIPTGVRGLDDVLAGGLPANSCSLLSGGPGTGKTVLALEFLVRGAQAGEAGLLLSFEEPEEALRSNAATLGWDLGTLERDGLLEVIHAPPPVRSVRAGDFDLTGLLALIDQRVRATGARRIVLDALDQLVRTIRDPEREHDELQALYAWLKERRLTALLTVKAKPDGELVYPFLGFLADCLVHLDQRIERQVRTRRLRVVKYRGSAFLSNEYPYLITPRGVAVMPVSTIRMAARQSLGERASSGDRALDEILGGGYLGGSTGLIAGPTGSGKTTLASLFAEAACARGEPVVFISYEESRDALTAAMASVGIDLESCAADGRLRLITTMPEAAGVEEHLFGNLEALDETGARHMIIDAASACIRMGSRPAAFDFLVRLISEARRRGVTCLLTTQTQGDGLHDLSGIGISSLIDTVVVLQYAPQDGALRRRLLVLKSRGSSHSNRFHWLEIGEDGIALSSAAAETGELPAGHLAPRGSRG